MLESSVVREYTLNRLDSLSGILEKKKTGYTFEDFHDLRVEIKKLNAISRILKFSYRPFKRKKFIGPYKKLFSCAGKIREAQLETVLFEELQLATSLETYLKSKNCQIRKDKIRFEKMAKALRKRIEKDRHSLEFYFNSISREDIYRFTFHLDNQVVSLINKADWTEEEIHELRKKLKELLYTISIFRISGTESKSIDALQDLVGKWHDKVVMEAQLSDKKLLRKINKQERITMKLAVEYLHHSSVEMHDKIRSEIRKRQNVKGFLQRRDQTVKIAKKKVNAL